MMKMLRNRLEFLFYFLLHFTCWNYWNLMMRMNYWNLMRMRMNYWNLMRKRMRKRMNYCCYWTSCYYCYLMRRRRKRRNCCCYWKSC